MSRHPDLENNHNPELIKKEPGKTDKIKYNCYKCGKTNKVPKGRYKKDKPNYCSNECYQEIRKENASIHHNCPACGKTFKTKKHLVKNRECHTCSPECRMKQLHETIKTERKTVECSAPTCQKQVTRKTTILNKHPNPVCSTKCLSNFLSQHFKGENGPGYIHGNHGERKYPGKFANKREKIIQRDNEKCQICGLKRGKHKEKYTLDIEVHHIDNDPENNKDNNLITLCTSCNIKIEHENQRPKTPEQIRTLNYQKQP